MSIIVLIEILILCTGGTLYSFRTGEKISESLAKGLFLCALTMSFCFQIAFLLGEPKISFFLEIIFCGFSLYLIKTKWQKFKELLRGIRIFFLQHKLSLSILSILWIYLFLMAVILPPFNWDSMSYNLSRIFLFQQEKSLFLTNVSTERLAVFPVGADILHHSLLRFYTDYGIAIFSFIAYLIICFGTYALSRRYAKPQHSLTATFIIASLSELVLQSTSTKNDIWTASVAVICFILIHRILTSINIEDLVLLPITLAFGISCKTTFVAFGLPFTCLFSLLLLKKYQWKYLLKILSQYNLYFLLSILPILVFFPLFHFYHNYIHFGSWQGSEWFVSHHKHSDGIIGTTGNIVRYLLQSIDFLEPSEQMFKWVTSKLSNQEGYTITDVLVNFYNQYFYPIFENKGIMDSHEFFKTISNNKGYSFFITRTNADDYSWFGPFAFFLIIPSLIFALIKGDLYLKLVSVNLIAYFLIVCNQVGWQPWANRFFSLFFASSGITVAYLFAQLKVNKLIYNVLIFLSLIILTYTVSFNSYQPLLKGVYQSFDLSQLNIINWPQTIKEKSIWSLTNFGKNRTFYTDIKFGHDHPPNILSKFVPLDSTVGLVTTHDTWIYPYLLYNPEIRIIPIPTDQYQIWEKAYQSEGIDHVFCLEVSCDDFANLDKSKVVWTSQEGKIGMIVKLQDSLSSDKKP